MLARPGPSSPPPSSHRAPRKSNSYLSLRREKDKPSVSLDSYPTSSDPSASRPTYFEAYPKPKSIRSHKAKSRQSNSISSPASSSSKREKAAAKDSYTFPTTDYPDDSGDSPEGIDVTPRSYSRTRSSPGPSGRPGDPWVHQTPPALRFSGSSTQHSETPPDTPLDSFFFPDFPEMVSAPTAGVETMDALVDNMNGGDDILSSTLSRARFGIPGHHPLYQPPLPTPPPGVVLGRGKARRPKKHKPPVRRTSFSEDDEDDDDIPNLSTPSRRRRPLRPSTTRSASNSTITPSTSAAITPQSSTPRTSTEDILPPHRSTEAVRRQAIVEDNRKSVVPSISEIIRAHAPEGQIRPRPSLSRAPSRSQSHGHSTLHEESETEQHSPLPIEEESEMTARSSIDSIADEIQQTLKHQSAMRPVTAPHPSIPPSSFLRRHSTVSDNASVGSPRSEGGAASIYSSSVTSSHPPFSPYDGSFLSSLTRPSTPSQAVAQYLRSARLTTLLKLTRSPHASADNPLTVSLSDLGSSSGFPVVVFLGLGCVRHIMGLYDEMAECLGLRLITIDRWGLGRTEPRAKSAKGIVQWASVVEEILDLLHIERCSVMAHSAGAPYALSFSNTLRNRIQGDICLLAPWVGGSEGGGYRWLKYVPNGILKTAQAAEWKLQAWMIGKPPTISYQGIGYTARPTHLRLPGGSPSNSSHNLSAVYPSTAEREPRPSIGSSTFSEYDDLRDFDGRFESRSTLGAAKYRVSSEPKRKTSRGFLGRLRGPSVSQPQSPTEDANSQGGKRLKALRSMGSLKSKSSKRLEPISPQLHPPLKLDVGLGLGDLGWTKSIGYQDSSDGLLTATPTTHSSLGHPRRTHQIRRSMSFTSPGSLPSSPAPSIHNSSFSATHSSLQLRDGSDTSYQAALGNALIAASHAESAKGTHNDLLQILNHDNHPWGFSYTSYPHKVKVWYGDRDEKIAENAVRWMEKTMGEDKCSVEVVRGADHGLMYRSNVVVEVLETIQSFWTSHDR